MLSDPPIELLRAKPPSQSHPLYAGSVVAGRYALGPAVAHGAMGSVHMAMDTELGRRVALKILRPELASDPVIAARFANEAHLVAQLSGPNVVHVYDQGRLASGEPFLVTEWIDGTSLEQSLTAHGPLPVALAVDLVIDACNGVAEAHAAGIVHRDIKPANLIVCTPPGKKPSVKVVDFGISKRLHSDTTLTHPGDSLGSPCYMSPEQSIGSAEVDARSDVWSLGVVLFELLTGRRPFDGESLAEVFAAILAEPAPSVRALRPEVDRGLEAVIWRCLDKEPARRFRNADALGQALTLFGSEAATARAFAIASGGGFEPLPSLPRSSARGLWVGVAVACGVLLASLVSVGAVSLPRPGAWLSEPVLGSAPAQRATHLALEPRTELPRGIYARRAARDGTLRAEPERTTASGLAYAGASWDPAPATTQTGVPVNQVQVQERRVFLDGKLVDVESEVVEPAPEGARDAEH